MPTCEQRPPRIPPTSVVKRAFALRSRLRRAADAMIPPQGMAAERTFLLAEIKMLGVVCELRIPEAIDNGATRARAIADRVGAQADAIERVVPFLASRGWFARKRDGSTLPGPTVQKVDHCISSLSLSQWPSTHVPKLGSGSLAKRRGVAGRTDRQFFVRPGRRLRLSRHGPAAVHQTGRQSVSTARTAGTSRTWRSRSV